METQVQKFIAAHRLIEAGDRVLAGVSGGADSVALLIVLHQLQSSLSFELSVCHLNHMLRGPASDGDAQFVRDVCETLQMPCYVGACDVSAACAETGESLEAAARRTRYAFFAEAAAHFQADKLALAHHRDDQCETILFNLLRGSSFHGLRGIPITRPLHKGSRVQIVRPLLEVPKAALEDYLRGRGAAWRHDHTNDLLLASRNIIRHKVLPAMEEVHASFREHVLDIGRQAGQIEAVLNERAGRVMAAARRDSDTIRIEQWRLAGLPEIVAAEIVRAMLVDVGAGLGQITARHLRSVAHLANRLELPGGWLARVEYGWLILGPKTGRETAAKETTLPIGGACQFGRWTFSAELRDFDEHTFHEFLRIKTSRQEWLDADKVEGELKVRYAREGERFRPLGAPGSKKVGDFLTDVKAGWSARPAVVVADAKGIIWLVGRRIDERMKTGRSTTKILQIEMRDKP